MDEGAGPRRSDRRRRVDAQGEPDVGECGDRAAAKRSRRDQGASRPTPIWMEPPPWLYLPAAGIVGGRQLRVEEDCRNSLLHGGSGVGQQTVAAALISGRGVSPGRERAAEDVGDETVRGARGTRRRDKEERLRDAHASISISLGDHAERVARKAQRAKDGGWPAADHNAASARERMDALRERVRAKALVAAGGGETRLRFDASDRCGQGGGDWQSDGLAPALEGDNAQHRGDREQLDSELPLDLRIPQAIEASQIHSTSHLDREAGGVQGDGVGGADGRRSVPASARWPLGDDSLAGGASGAAVAGEAIRTAAADAARFAAWHSNAADAPP